MNTTEMNALKQLGDSMQTLKTRKPIPNREEYYLSSMHVLGSECRWGMASSDQPKITEHAYSCTPFQDGVDKNRKGADVERRLADKTGFVGCIPLSPHLFI